MYARITYDYPSGRWDKSAAAYEQLKAKAVNFFCRERGEEAVFMRKEDQKLLDALLKKERAQAVQGKT